MIIYLLVALFATMIGASAGLGGGVIIKPVLDTLGDFNVVTISILSSITILSMAAVATIRQILKGFKITREIFTVALGATFGGILGSVLFAYVRPAFRPDTITIAQSAIMILLLLLCLFYNRIPQMRIKSVWTECIIGGFLGMLGSFLGIGGGPINVAALIIVMGVDLKKSTKISIFIILFSQIAGIATKAANGVFAHAEDLSMLYVMIPAAIIGGLIGAQLNIVLSDNKIRLLYKGTVILVIAVCIYNISVLI